MHDIASWHSWYSVEIVDLCAQSAAVSLQSVLNTLVGTDYMHQCLLDMLKCLLDVRVVAASFCPYTTHTYNASAVLLPTQIPTVCHSTDGYYPNNPGNWFESYIREYQNNYGRWFGGRGEGM